jgi:hypothetical protein
MIPTLEQLILAQSKLTGWLEQYVRYTAITGWICLVLECFCSCTGYRMAGGIHEMCAKAKIGRIAIEVTEDAYDTTEKYVADSNLNIRDFGRMFQELHTLQLSQTCGAINLSRAAMASIVASTASWLESLVDSRICRNLSFQNRNLFTSTVSAPPSASHKLPGV